jgi:hypothetical protein
MSVKCGNHPRQDRVYHETPDDVRACYASNGADVMKEAMTEPAPPASFRSEGWSSGKPLPFAPGRYAILGGAMSEDVVKFYKVDAPTEGRWAGYVFVKVQASDELHAIKNRDEKTRIIHEIAKDPEGAMLRYGRELGHCGHCGRTLTNEESRARGIGPICAGKMGW